MKNSIWFRKIYLIPYKKTILFFFMVVISSIVMSCIHVQAKNDFEERHALIKETVTADLSKTKPQKTGNASLACKDSTHILLIEEYSKIVEKQNKDIKGIKQTLDEEFNKIENEYESQEIWTGLLTIVFLVFTFYSLLKTEEQERQAQDTLRQIKRSEKRSRSIISNIDAEKDSALKSMNKGFDDWKKEKNDDVKNIVNTLFCKSEKELQKGFESWCTTFKQTKESEMTTWCEIIKKSTNDRINDIFDKNIEQMIQNFGEELKRQLDSIDKNAKQQMEIYMSQLIEKTETPEPEPPEIESTNLKEPNEAEVTSSETIEEEYEIEPEEPTSDKA